MSGEGVLRDRTVDQPRVVLPVDVLLDRAARAAQPERVERVVVRGDEAALDHDRRLTAELEVVVDAGLVAGRVEDGVALPEPEGIEHLALVRAALVVADPDPALEVEDRLPVPGRQVRRRDILRAGRERRDRVDEPVDRPALPADDEVDGPPVGRGRLRHVDRPRRGRVVGLPLAAGRPVLERDDRRSAAIRVERWPELRRPAVAARCAQEHLLVRAREHRPGDRVVRQRQLGPVGCGVPGAGNARVDRARAERQPHEDALERVRDDVVRRERLRHVGAVQRHLHARGRRGCRDDDADPYRAAAHVLRRARDGDDLQSAMQACRRSLSRTRERGENERQRRHEDGKQ